jgi:hypothetical protein
MTSAATAENMEATLSKRLNMSYEDARNNKLLIQNH